MSESAEVIDSIQNRWAGSRQRDAGRRDYLPTVGDNLFRPLHSASEAEFRLGDGAELDDRRGKPAKMRALISSSALAANFFDPWRTADKAILAAALDLPAPIADLRFEYKPDGYPVRPRSPNLDVLLHLTDGRKVGVESKFSEPYRSDEGHGVLSRRYFPETGPLWRYKQMAGAQAIADRLRPEWHHLDAAQLLKHMLGLAYAREKPDTLLYIWFDTERVDALAHQREAERFASEVSGDSVKFMATTYQATFRRLIRSSEPADGWYEYMAGRYFQADTARTGT